MKRLILALACIAIAVAAGGCNTVRGVGKDIERGGEKIQDATH